MTSKKMRHALRNCAKSGCIRIKAAGAVEDQLSLSPANQITIHRGEALGLYAVVAAALAEDGDKFLLNLTDETAIEYLKYINDDYGDPADTEGRAA